uniref:uncharacterized protein LOC122587827 n=1 Tax=Erigeron canadensis TaxID=72917 RepID=UPI001CB8AFD9|nr:uncharacterized protein LOC122587827 [Erigeron canadensis]
MKLLVDEMKKKKPVEPPPEPVNPAKELLQMLKIVAGEEADEQARVATIPKSATKSRFCDWVANYAFPEGQKVPTIVGTYDGTRDPEDHLAIYDQAVLTEKWVDPVACHLFPGTLQGYALEWFTKLPEKRIQDYADLKKKFITQFAQQKKRQGSHLEAHLIRQRGNESLRDVIARHTKEYQKIPSLPESQQVSGFTLALLPGDLQDDLCKRIPSTFREATERAFDFIRSRETALLMKGAIGRDRPGESLGAGRSGGGRYDARRNDRRFDHRDTKRREERRDDMKDDRREKRSGPYDRIVNLIKSLREILKTERVGENFKPPRPMIHRTGKKDMSKYCEFHEDHGHETNACRELKIEIKRALDEGKLEHLVPGAKQGKQATQAKKAYTWQKKDGRYDRPPPPDGHVYMIREKHKYEKRKVEVLEPWGMVSISFPLVEAVSSNPVVIQARVANFEVRKVYLDNENSSDIIYDHCFQKLPQRIKDIKRPSRT